MVVQCTIRAVLVQVSGQNLHAGDEPTCTDSNDARESQGRGGFVPRSPVCKASLSSQIVLDIELWSDLLGYLGCPLSCLLGFPLCHPLCMFFMMPFGFLPSCLLACLQICFLN